MDYKLIESGEQKVIEILSAAVPLSSEQDALELIALCGQYDTNLLLLHSDALADDFFRLSTGVAGRILQKFMNYYIKAAVVVPGERIRQGKFEEMVLEVNRGSRFRVMESREKAENWLLWKERS